MARIPIRNTTLTLSQLAELHVRLGTIEFAYTDNTIFVEAQYERQVVDALCEILPPVRDVELTIPPVRKTPPAQRHNRTVRNAEPFLVSL